MYGYILVHNWNLKSNFLIIHSSSFSLSWKCYYSSFSSIYIMCKVWHVAFICFFHTHWEGKEEEEESGEKVQNEVKPYSMSIYKNNV